ncbi:hypothetical protein ACA086_06135 [Muriicola sp. E247]|uniref:hypothetical protein n=1 Tax=Muriicola sp. E247 TaxID=3242730 RepID=UPI003524555B
MNIRKSENLQLIKALNSAKLIGENKESYLSVRVYSLDNGSISAGFDTSEVSHNLIIAVSGFDENPDQNAFEIGPFINPKFVQWNELQKYKKGFEIEYGIFEKRERLRLEISLKELKIIK